MQKAICCVPVSAMRATSSHKSEMVSQLLFGESVSLLEKEQEWQKVKGIYDGYEGWCPFSHLILLKRQPAFSGEPVLTAEWVNKIIWKGVPMYIPFSCDLSLIRQEDLFEEAVGFRYEGKIFHKKAGTSFPEQTEQVSRFFLNSTYLWGGKSVFGIDCSGFTQTVFRMLGKQVLRDAWQQAEQGAGVSTLSAVQPGDLAFFNNDQGRIVHVGIILASDQIIHASGKVRIDTIDREGIVNLETGERTHRLHSIKRYS